MAEIGDFRSLGNNRLARVHVQTNDAQGGQATVTGQRSINIFGRMAARLSEWFGSGEQRNINAGQALVGAVRRAYGQQAADAVTDHLRTRALAGKPLSSRRVDICVRLAEKFLVPAQVPHATPAILEALRDPAKPHLAAIRHEIALTQAAQPRAANSKALLEQFEQAANQSVIRKAQTLEQRCNAYPSIAAHPAWRARVLRTGTETPIDQVLTSFLAEHGIAEPPIFTPEVRQALAAETGPSAAVRSYLNNALGVDHSPGGSAFGAILAKAADEAFGAGIDTAQLPLAGLKQDILSRVRQLAGQNAQQDAPLTTDQIAQASLEAVRARAEALINLQREVKNSDLDERTQQLMGKIWFRNPGIGVAQLKDQALFCGHLHDCARAFAAGNVEEAISAYIEGYRLIDPNAANNALKVAVDMLSPQERVAALDAIRSSDLLNELRVLSSINPMEIDVEQPNALTLLGVNRAQAEFELFKGELAFRSGLNKHLLDVEADLKPRSFSLSDDARDFLNRYHAVRVDWARAAGEPEPGALDLDSLAESVPPAINPTEAVRSAYQAVLAEDRVDPPKGPPAFDQALVVEAPAAGVGRPAIPQAAVALSGRIRMNEILSETRNDLAANRAAVTGSLTFDQAREEPGLNQFMIDVISNDRHVNLYVANGEPLFKNVEPGQARWSRWQGELGKHFKNETALGNALGELPNLFTQRVLADLVTLNAPAHGFAPAMNDQDAFAISLLGTDTDGFLRVGFTYSGPVTSLFRGNPPQIIPGSGCTYEMNATFRYKPDTQPGGAGELVLDRHVARYELNPVPA
ncbi:MAG: hypothetical protein KGR68_06315 [Betaproteobacteria bacterium]|nr:hypothetical protein [Betaproteobacteria bacterium]